MRVFVVLAVVVLTAANCSSFAVDGGPAETVQQHREPASAPSPTPESTPTPTPTSESPAPNEDTIVQPTVSPEHEIDEEPAAPSESDLRERSALAADFVGEWLTESCDLDFMAAQPVEPSNDEDDFEGYGPTCITHSFWADGSYGYHYRTDYEVEAAGRWTIEVAGSDFSRIIIEESDVFKASVDEEGVLHLGDYERYVRQQTDERPIRLIDVGHTFSEIIAGTWHRPVGVPYEVFDIEVVTFSPNGRFVATMAAETCTGYWVFSAAAGQAGQVVMYADEPCSEPIHYLQLADLDGRLFVNRLEYFEAAPGPITYFADARFRGERALTATARFDGPLQLGEESSVFVAVAARPHDSNNSGLVVHQIIVESYHDGGIHVLGEVSPELSIGEDGIVEFEVPIVPVQAGEYERVDVRVAVSGSVSRAFLQTHHRVFEPGEPVPSSAALPQPTPTPLPTPTPTPTPDPTPDPPLPAEELRAQRVALITRLAGEWASAACFEDSYDCKSFVFDPDGTYSFQYPRRGVDAEGSWTAFPAGPDAARILLANGDIMIARINTADGLILGKEDEYLRQRTVSGDIVLRNVTPRPAGESFVGSWRPPDGAYVGGRQDALFVWGDGSFVAVVNERMCSGYWGHAGEGDANGVDAYHGKGQLLLYFERDCGNFVQENRVNIYRDRLFLSGLEYFGDSSGSVTNIGRARRRDESGRWTLVATATAEFDEVLRAGQESTVRITVESHLTGPGGEPITIENVTIALGIDDQEETIGTSSPGIEVLPGGLVQFELQVAPTQATDFAHLRISIEVSAEVSSFRFGQTTTVEPPE